MVPIKCVMLVANPLSRYERSNSKNYISGISCHNCFDKTSDEKKKNLLKEINKSNCKEKRLI